MCPGVEGEFAFKSAEPAQEFSMEFILEYIYTCIVNVSAGKVSICGRLVQDVRNIHDPRFCYQRQTKMDA